MLPLPIWLQNFLFQKKLLVEQQMVSVRRENFGPGDARARAYCLILAGAGCELQIDPGIYCDVPSRYTVDFDVMGGLETIPVCTSTHGAIVRERVANDLGKHPQDNTFGMNGWGRA